jgi:hypothetical protein
LLLRENRQEDHVVGIRTAHDLADTGGRNALDDEQVAALFPFAQVCRDAVQRPEVRSILLPVWKGLEPGSGYWSYVVSSTPSSATNTASSRAGSVALAFSLTGWADPGGSNQLSPAL